MMAYGDRKYQLSQQAEEITSLRKDGQLKQAYDRAKFFYSHGSREETFMQAYTWVFYDCLKRYYDERTRFANDIKAYCSVLAQIRRFPTNADRDEMFIENLCNHVLKVGWGLRKQQKFADLLILRNEICQWPKDSLLYTPDIARMLLISTKPYDQETASVLRWLGVCDAPWSEIATGHLSIQSPDNVAATALTWAFYDDLKQFVGDDGGRKTDVDRFTQTLSLIRISIPDAFGRHEASDYAISKFVHIGWECRERKNLNGVETLLSEAIQWPRTSPMHDEDVLTMFSVCLRERPAGIIKVVDWYGLDSLSRQYYEAREYEGKQLSSRAQDLVKAYLDALMSNNADGNPVASADQKNNGCNQVAALLEDPRCAEWIWETYKLGKLLSDVGRFEEARQLLAPIVAMRQSEPWAWFAYGTTWATESPDRYEKCLFMGLSRSRNPQYDKGLHEAAAELFASKGQFEYAKTEVQTLKTVAEENGWKESEIVQILESESWFEEAVAAENEALYQDLSQGAESIVAEDMPWSEFYVEWVDKEKGLTCIVTQGQQRITYDRKVIKDAAVAESVQEGLCYRGHFGPERKSLMGRIEVFPEASIAQQFTSSYAGQIELVNNYGFVNSGRLRIWISPKLLEGKAAKKFQNVSGECRKVYKAPKENPSSGKWMWEAMSIELGDEASPSSYRREGKGVFKFATSRYLGKRDFGFVSSIGYGDYFVSAALVEKHQLTERQSIDYIAEKSWDSKKNRWGWKVIEITKVEGTAPNIHEDNYWSNYEEDSSESEYEEINARYEKLIESQDAASVDNWDDAVERWRRYSESSSEENQLPSNTSNQ